MNIVDILRAILIGQTCWTAIWLAVIYVMLWRQKLRPGFFIGISILAIGDFGTMLYVLIATLSRFGEPASFVTWLAMTAIVTESFGCVLVAAHLFFHDEALSSKIRSWFKMNE